MSETEYMNVMLAAFGVGGWEVILIIAVVLILFGANKLPELAKGLGSGIKEFKKATREVTDEIQNADTNNNTTSPANKLPPGQYHAAKQKAARNQGGLNGPPVPIKTALPKWPISPQNRPMMSGGPVKTFLEHLEDFRWLLVKCAVTLGLAMLVCLFAANYVIAAIKWPISRAHVSYPGTNQVVTVNFGTNHLGNFELSPEQNQALNLGTNRFIAIKVQPLTLGTNQVLGWAVDTNGDAAERAQEMKIDLVNLSPAGAFFVAVQAGALRRSHHCRARPALFHRPIRFSGAEVEGEEIYLPRHLHRRRLVHDRGVLLLFRADAGGVAGLADVFKLAGFWRDAMAGGGLYQLCLPVHAGHGAGI